MTINWPKPFKSKGCWIVRGSTRSGGKTSTGPEQVTVSLGATWRASVPCPAFDNNKIAAMRVILART